MALPRGMTISTLVHMAIGWCLVWLPWGSFPTPGWVLLGRVLLLPWLLRLRTRPSVEDAELSNVGPMQAWVVGTLVRLDALPGWIQRPKRRLTAAAHVVCQALRGNRLRTMAAAVVVMARSLVMQGIQGWEQLHGPMPVCFHRAPLPVYLLLHPSSPQQTAPLVFGA